MVSRIVIILLILIAKSGPAGLVCEKSYAKAVAYVESTPQSPHKVKSTFKEDDFKSRHTPNFQKKKKKLWSRDMGKAILPVTRKVSPHFILKNAASRPLSLTICSVPHDNGKRGPPSAV